MSRKPDAWMPLYISDYLGDTTHLNTEQHGAYLLLLMTAWKRGGFLPSDQAQLAAIARLDVVKWRKIANTVLPFFTLEDGQLIQRRLAEEYADAVAVHEAQKANGAKGGRPKKTTHEKPMGFDSLNPSPKPTHNPDETPSPSPSKASETIVSGASADPIWGSGLAFLVRKGIPMPQARSLLGKLKKEVGDIRAGALLADAETEDISNPAPWLMQAAKQKQAGPQSKAGQKLALMENLKNAMDGERDSNGVPETYLLGVGTGAIR